MFEQYEPASLAKKRTALAISCGWPARLMLPLVVCPGAEKPASIGVSIAASERESQKLRRGTASGLSEGKASSRPGATALMRMPAGPTSAAADAIRPRRANLDAA